jgi:hypothetical protein
MKVSTETAVVMIREPFILYPQTKSNFFIAKTLVDHSTHDDREMGLPLIFICRLTPDTSQLRSKLATVDIHDNLSCLLLS